MWKVLDDAEKLKMCSDIGMLFMCHLPKAVCSSGWGIHEKKNCEVIIFVNYE